MPVNRIRRWLNIATELDDCPVVAPTAIRMTPDNTIHWPNCEIMLGLCLRHWANIISTKTLQALNHDNSCENTSTEDFLNTKVLNIGTSNVILYMFIRTGVQNSFPHSASLFPPNRTQTQAKRTY